MPRSKQAKTRKASKKISASSAPTFHYSMQQEARNTEARNLWRMGLQLRHQAVQFVSAGNLESDRKASRGKNDEEAQPLPPCIAPDIQNPLAIDPTGENLANTGSANSTTRSPTPPSDFPSDEEIVFNGRRNRSEPNSDFAARRPHVISSDLETACIESSERTGLSSRTGALTDESESIDGLPVYMNLLSPQDRVSELSDADDVLADYIANIDEDYGHLRISHASSQQRFVHQDVDMHHEKPIQEPRSDHCNNTSDDSDLESPDDDENFVCSDDNDDNAVLQHAQNSDTYELSEIDTHGSSFFSSRRRNVSEKSLFASATAFADTLEADPYHGFDIMDFNRPSLRKQKKDKGRMMDMGLFDTELATELQTAWKSDRMKKKIRKQERENLRAQGLLGRRKDAPDLKVKYAHGISIEDLKSEIRSFLLSSKNSLPLPPMPKQRRMLIHQMANALSLNSQSRGKGSSRFPVLSKTSRTPKYTPGTISQAEHILSKDKYSSRATNPWVKKSGKPAKGKGAHSSVTYVDGDVVGASAPEIGAGNRGRAMLEKMGWSTGTALGANHNKGILLPVAHIVKNTKAGLG